MDEAVALKGRLDDGLDPFGIGAVADEGAVYDVAERGVFEERVVVSHDVEVRTCRFVPALDGLTKRNVQSSHTTSVADRMSVVESDTLPHDVDDGVIGRLDVELHPRIVLIPLLHGDVEGEFERVPQLGRCPHLRCDPGVVARLAVHRVVIGSVRQ